MYCHYFTPDLHYTATLYKSLTLWVPQELRNQMKSTRTDGVDQFKSSLLTTNSRNQINWEEVQSRTYRCTEDNVKEKFHVKFQRTFA